MDGATALRTPDVFTLFMTRAFASKRDTVSPGEKSLKKVHLTELIQGGGLGGRGGTSRKAFVGHASA